jgi:hypothetical protein
MLGHETPPGTGRAEPDRGPMTAATRAVATRQEVVHADTLGSTVITAEIPAVPLHRSYGVLLPDGSVWYPDSKRRLPAPWPLRFFVWVLALLLVLLLAGLAVVEWHPSWLSALRHTVGTAPSIVIPPGQSSTTVGPTGTTQAGGKSACVTGAGGVTCTLPVDSYQIDFTTTERVSVGIKSLTTNTYIYGATQPAGQSHVTSVTGAATLEVFASGGSFTVTNGAAVLVPSTPAKYAVLYTFEPSTGTTGG